MNEKKSSTSINIQKPDIQPFLWVVFFILIFLSFLEILVQNPWIQTLLPYRSPSADSKFSELDVKYKRLKNLKNVDCLFFGSSMVDADLDPKIFEDTFNLIDGQKHSCMNMGFSGSMVESSGAVAKSLINRYSIKFIIWGLSPIDMDKNFINTRPIAQMPVYTYYDGKPSFEGWLFNTFDLPWYFAAIPHLKNSQYLEDQNSWDRLLDEHGVRIDRSIGVINKEKLTVILPDFSINPVDMDMLKSAFVEFRKRNINIIVVEMPVHPDVYPYLVGGGDPIYQKEFLVPVQEYMEKSGINFIRTQPAISEIVSNNDWTNINHLNYQGAEKLSAYVARKIHDEGILK